MGSHVKSTMKNVGHEKYLKKGASKEISTRSYHVLNYGWTHIQEQKTKGGGRQWERAKLVIITKQHRTRNNCPPFKILIYNILGVCPSGLILESCGKSGELGARTAQFRHNNRASNA
jgi:hypothetical protein